MIKEKLPAEFKQKWVDALRSGKYTQTKGRLYKPEDGTMCCLGVACVVAGVSPDKLYFEQEEYRENREILCKMPSEVNTEDIKNFPSVLKGCSVIILAEMNDGLNEWENNAQSFEQIADWIEQNF